MKTRTTIHFKDNFTEASFGGLSLYAGRWSSSAPLSGPPGVKWYPDFPATSTLLVSQGNAFRKLGKSAGRIGGPFKVQHEIVKSVTDTPYTYATNPSSPGGTFSQRFRGRFRATGHIAPDTSPFRTPVFSSSDDLDAFGTTAIANVEPTNPLSGLTVFLGELKREGLPSLPGIQTWKDKTRLAKSAGGEYLNKEFGWDPLIGDIRKFVNVSRNAEKHIDEYSRGSGRKQHRTFTLPTEVTTNTTSGTGTYLMYPDLGNTFFVTPPSWTQIYTTEVTRWFEGSFTYYLPPLKPGGSNFERNRRLAHKLYGAGITPEAVWDLTPWSWAIDWVSNAGDVIHNIGAFRDNGLVMHYGYVMETIVRRVETHITNIRTKQSEWVGGANAPSNMECHAVLETITKQRRVATPYGFGLSDLDFSPFQLSILGALGISRS